MEEITRLEALAETIAESVVAQDWQALDEVLADAGDRELLARLRSLAGIGPGSRATVLPEPGPAREQEPDGERRKPSPGAQTAQEPMTPDQRLQPGDSLGGRYRIQAHLQRGGMGDVYHAIDERLRIPVALKLLRPGLGSEETVLKQFQQEALLAQVR